MQSDAELWRRTLLQWPTVSNGDLHGLSMPAVQFYADAHTIANRFSEPAPQSYAYALSHMHTDGDRHGHSLTVADADVHAHSL